MSITSALMTAASGLSATARGAEVVSSNIANANSDNYGRRELLLGSAQYSGGVRIAGVARMVNANILAEYRTSHAGFSRASTLTQFSKMIENTIGIPGNPNSLPDRLSHFEAALIQATARPDSEIRLNEVLNSAADMVSAINQLGNKAVEARQSAENMISRDVDRLNSGLEQIASLNLAIGKERANGRDTAGLEDARQAVVDDLSGIVALREVRRENGQISLFTEAGAALLDGSKPVSIKFTTQRNVTEHSSTAGGSLHFLEIDGRALTESQMKMYSGGSLSASFQIRDELAPEMQDRADQLAADLIGRFEGLSQDSTLTATQPGLFTQAGGRLDDPTPKGLAQKLSINASIDPEQGGEIWRLREGIYAPAISETGNAALLEAMIQTLQTSGSTMSSHMTELSSFASMKRIDSENRLAMASTHDLALRQSLAADGVDTDRELERLLLLEQAYAANVRVIQAADTMLDAILRI